MPEPHLEICKDCDNPMDNCRCEDWMAEDDASKPAASPVAGVSADKAALKGIMALFSEPSPFYIKKLGSPITNADQAKIDAAFIAIEEALSKPDGLETATDEELDAALRANGLDPDEVLSTGFNKVCAKLKEVATERDLLKAELLKLAQPSAEGDGRMSKRYRAMVYFAVATLHLYRDELFPVTPDENLGTFAELNKHVITQVIAEAREYFAYELSHEQIGQAIAAYLTPSVSLPTPPVLPAPVAKEGRES